MPEDLGVIKKSASFISIAGKYGPDEVRDNEDRLRELYRRMRGGEADIIDLIEATIDTMQTRMLEVSDNDEEEQAAHNYIAYLKKDSENNL